MDPEMNGGVANERTHRRAESKGMQSSIQPLRPRMSHFVSAVWCPAIVVDVYRAGRGADGGVAGGARRTARAAGEMRPWFSGRTFNASRNLELLRKPWTCIPPLA